MKNVSFEIVDINASNACFVGEITRSVYGEDFPGSHLYEPDILCSEIEEGRLIVVMAADENGQAIGYVSLYRSTPNPRMWEIESIAVVPGCANADVSMRLIRYCANLAKFQMTSIDGFFGESVCCHYFSQFFASKIGMIDCAIQLDQFNGTHFNYGKSDGNGAKRISSVLSFCEKTKPTEEDEYAPQEYDNIVRYITNQLYPRKILPSTEKLPASGMTCLTECYYPPAQIMTVDTASIGSNWVSILEDILDKAKDHQIMSLQVTLNMSCPWIGAAVSVMREKGFFFGGVAPRWFGTDGLLMQKLPGSATEYDKIKLRSKNAKRILDFIKSERKALEG